MTHLFRGTPSGTIIDADGKVVGRIVPPEPTPTMVVAAMADTGCATWEIQAAYRTMLSAAPADWSGVAVRVPERSKVPPFGWLPDDGGEVWAEGFNEALDAIMGAK